MSLWFFMVIVENIISWFVLYLFMLLIYVDFFSTVVNVLLSWFSVSVSFQWTLDNRILFVIQILSLQHDFQEINFQNVQHFLMRKTRLDVEIIIFEVILDAISSSVWNWNKVEYLLYLQKQLNRLVKQVWHISEHVK